MGGKDITTLRGTLDYLEQEGELLKTDAEIDPIYEIAGVEKALENGPAILFNNIKGYPNARDAGNLFARKDRLAKIFDVDTHQNTKFKFLKAIKHPLAPKVVEAAPCQEVVLTENLDVLATIPIIKHTEKDAGRILGGGIIFLGGEYFDGGSHISLNRVHFRGKDWASISTGLEYHLYKSVGVKHRGKKVPITINIGNSPAVCECAGGAGTHTMIPPGSDELAIAGALQGKPVEIVKARTVDAYAIADSEWVIEGYIDTSTKVWESDESEQNQKADTYPFFPEWPGYLGRAYKVFRFQVTAITHRSDRPIFYSPLADSYEGLLLGLPFREACLYEEANRLYPGLVQDVNILYGMGGWSSAVYQIKKRRPADEGYQKNVLLTAFGTLPGCRIAMAVDEDIDIYCAEDLLWALSTRVDPTKDIFFIPGKAHAFIPVARYNPETQALAIDATAPFQYKFLFERAHYPVDRVDVNRWFGKEEVTRALAQQLDSERAVSMAKNGW